MNDYTAHYVTCHLQESEPGGDITALVLTDNVFDKTLTVTANATDYDFYRHVLRVFRDAAEYRRVFDEMRHAGMCFKWGTMGPDIAATVLEAWNGWRDALTEKREVEAEEAEKSKQALKELLG